MELLHGQSDSNKTKIRTTVNARNCVSNLDEACHIAANFRGCLEALFQCKKDDESPIVYQLTGETLEDWPSPSDLSHPFFQRDNRRSEAPHNCRCCFQLLTTSLTSIYIIFLA